MAYDPVHNVFATGELGPKPVVYIWDPENMTEKVALKGGVVKGIECMSFSPDGSKLACVCIDDNHMVVIFDTQTKELMFCEKGDTAKILDCSWIDET
jgi:WD40 repeat protein